MKHYVIMKIDKRYYLINVTDKESPVIEKIGTFTECFTTYIQYVEFNVLALGEAWGEVRTNYHLHIKRF